MLTSAHWKDIIISNFNDSRTFSIQAFINRLIERKVYGDGIERYRIKDLVTNSWVTSLQDFIVKLDVDSLVADYFYYSEKVNNVYMHPTVININNFEVYLNEHSKEDSIYFQMFGKSNIKKIMLIANYVSDADINLPLKIIEIKLVSKV